MQTGRVQVPKSERIYASKQGENLVNAAGTFRLIFVFLFLVIIAKISLPENSGY